MNCPYCGVEIPNHVTTMDLFVCLNCGKEMFPNQMAQETLQKQKLRNSGWIFAIFGGLLTLVGGCMTVVFTFYAFSEEAAEGARTGGILVIIGPFLCTLPILALGIVPLVIGIKRLRKIPPFKPVALAAPQEKVTPPVEVEPPYDPQLGQRLMNCHLGHCISVTTTQSGNKWNTTKSYVSYPLVLYRKNNEDTEAQVVCNKCGAEFHVTVLGNVKRNIYERLKRLGIMLLMTLIFSWLPPIAVIVFILFTLFIFFPLSESDGITLRALTVTQDDHAILETKSLSGKRNWWQKLTSWWEENRA